MDGYEVTRRFEIDMGHRLQKHESKCAKLHGHRYRIELTLRAEDLDDVGRVIDFGYMKEKFGTWLDDNLDHKLMLEQDDDLGLDAGSLADAEGVLGIVRVPFSPTVENLTTWLYGKAVCLFDDESRQLGLVVEKLRVYETPNCWADFDRESWQG